MNRQDIAFFKAILESYEDVGIISVIDGKEGILEITYSAFYHETLQSIINDMKQYGIYLREVDRDGL